MDLAATLADTLAAAGFLAAGEEAALLTDAAAGDADRLAALLARRLAGEPVEHVVGWTEFCGLRLVVGPGTFVPRQKTEGLARRAADLLAAADDPVAVDLCSGVGAIACVMAAHVPHARVVASELDDAPRACLRVNAAPYGIEVVAGDLDEHVPPELRGRVAVLTANAPYVPTGSI
ncbi:MAG TPA: hypothetical protein VM030_08995, partial [Acidimicrobiales bacterium]|nr:hypothetical protein [Acidimicrobiales bacterium]